MSDDLRDDIVTALREQAVVMIQAAGDTPDIGADPNLWAIVHITTSTLGQLADRIERMNP